MVISSISRCAVVAVVGVVGSAEEGESGNAAPGRGAVQQHLGSGRQVRDARHPGLHPHARPLQEHWKHHERRRGVIYRTSPPPEPLSCCGRVVLFLCGDVWCKYLRGNLTTNTRALRAYCFVAVAEVFQGVTRPNVRGKFVSCQPRFFLRMFSEEKYHNRDENFGSSALARKF